LSAGYKYPHNKRSYSRNGEQHALDADCGEM